MKRNLTLLLLTLTINAIGQGPLDSAKVFQDIEMRGWTTAGAFTHFDDLKMEQRKVVLVSSVELQKLNSIILGSKSKKHRQTKIGGGDLFMMGFRGGKEVRILITTGTPQIIIDLTALWQYQLTETKQVELQELTAIWIE